MKKIILSILIIFSFAVNSEVSNHEYIFKVKKDSFLVKTSDTANQTNNQDCAVQEVSWLNCLSEISLLTHGQSIEITNTDEDYEGTVTISCSNGVLSQINQICEEKSTFNCDDPANVGQRGTDGECDGLLIVNNTSLRTMVSNNEDYSGNNIYTGQVTDLSTLFESKTVNYNITSWNTKNVITMRRLFFASSIFNQPIGNWNVSNVENFQGLFNSANAFNQPLNNWNVSKVTNMTSMFANTISFNQPLNNWNTSNVVSMTYMFNQANSFNQNISNWNVNNVYAYTNFKTNSPLIEENTPSKFL